MGVDEFWDLITAARQALPDRADAEDVAGKVTEMLSGRTADDIAAYDRALWDLIAVSFTEKLWGAAYQHLPRLAALYYGQD